MSLLFLPWAPMAARAIEALVPDDQPGDNPFRTRYVDYRALNQPALALGQATREALRMADVAQGMLRDAITVFCTDNLELIASAPALRSPWTRRRSTSTSSPTSSASARTSRRSPSPSSKRSENS